ncbi:MAG: hypothetical protein WDM90_12735 [Ferruginibacter sp.]
MSTCSDDKILLGWNALMITALCRINSILNDDTNKDLAVATMHLLFEKFRKDDTGIEFFHTYKKGSAKYPAFLDDYAYLIQACLQLQEVTSDTKYLDWAKDIVEFVIVNFIDEKTDFFFFTHKQQEDIIIRKKEIYDGATPSGNSIMAENLFYLAVVFNKPAWFNMAQKIVASLGTAITRYPTSFGIWASLLLKNTFGINELAIVGNNFEGLRNEALQQYIPGKILQAAKQEEEKYPLLAGKNTSGKTLIYLCREYACQQPVNSVEELMGQISKSYKI